MWATAWNIIRTFGGAAYRWAASHAKTVYNWVKNGATYEQIKDWVYNAVGWK
ncbi:aureocin A53 family class IId bacteriocin [Staphylococcus gallinarum]|uniref:aureocin A53 family class IId bacteriocin n=1 Tax=Staphylococcus gallinarum TaxID=1293 RepID=UPI001E4783D7|nr:aureocin A53 family class IId bacteriocin [Staphylococcus gallinarum]MCD8827225.1 aureocin A53 family class IId bacteriocin [Staphylococcus gallinarum]